MSAPAPMTGFDISEADAWWVQCVVCEEMELVFGASKDTDASTWATEHLRSTHPETLEVRP